MKTKRIICLYGGPGSGKCLKKGTEVIKLDGTLEKVENLVVGDRLLGPDGLERRVKNTCRGFDTLYEIRPVKGDSFYVTGNHRLSLVMSTSKCYNKKDEIVNITVLDVLNKPKAWQEKAKIYRAEAVSFDKKNLEIDPYYLGLWLGDGASANCTRVTTADSCTVDYLVAFAERFESPCIKCKKVGNSKYTYSVSGTNQHRNTQLVRSFKNKKLVNNKHIPHIYLTSSKEQRLELLAGLIDSDGHVYSSCIEITTKFSRLRDDLLFLCRSLGFAAYWSNKVVKNKTYFRVTISGNTDQIPVKLERKLASARKQKKNVLRTGFSVVKGHIQEEYVGIEVSGDSLFLLGDFTVTHNSTTCAGLFYKLKLLGYNAEMNREYVKEWCWEGRHIKEGDQSYFFAKQARKERVYMLQNLDFIITDSPLILTHFYGMKYDAFEQKYNTSLSLLQNHHGFCKDHGYKVDHFFIERAKPYSESGRYQTAAEASQFDTEILNILETRQIKFEKALGNKECVDYIIHCLEKN